MIRQEVYGAVAGVACVLLACSVLSYSSRATASRCEAPGTLIHRVGPVERRPTESQDASKPKAEQDTAAPIAKPHTWPYGDYRIVPVRVHLLRDSETSAAITKLTEQDIKRIFTKVNGIWHAAGIHLWVESIKSERPATTAGFEHAPSLPTSALLPLRPAETRPPSMFHVYYIGEMSPNGIFMRRDGIFVKESARLRPVKGGIDEPLPRVTAHELGHGMGLPHRQDTFNLLASGTTGTSLNDAEIEIVRTTVGKLDWALTPEQFLKLAEQDESDKKIESAKSRYSALKEIPGESPVKETCNRALIRIVTAPTIR